MDATTAPFPPGEGPTPKPPGDDNGSSPPSNNPVACCQPQTPASKYVQQALRDRFTLRYAGVGNACRRYECSHSPCGFSQHSWGNAIDLFSYAGDPNWKQSLNTVAEWLWANRRDLGLHGLIWNGKSWFTGRPDQNHYNHIHISFEPHGYGTPSCWEGASTDYWQHASWAGGGKFTMPHGVPPAMDATPTDEFPPPSDPNQLPLSKGDESQLVAEHQARLNLWFPNDTPLLVVDGKFGPKTEQWVFKAQRFFGLPQTGVIDEVLSALLFSPVPPPPVVIPEPVEIPPLPVYVEGYYGEYKRFYYPEKGRS